MDAYCTIMSPHASSFALPDTTYPSCRAGRVWFTRPAIPATAHDQTYGLYMANNSFLPPPVCPAAGIKWHQWIQCGMDQLHHTSCRIQSWLTRNYTMQCLSLHKQLFAMLPLNTCSSAWGFSHCMLKDHLAPTCAALRV